MGDPGCVLSVCGGGGAKARAGARKWGDLAVRQEGRPGHMGVAQTRVIYSRKIRPEGDQQEKQSRPKAGRWGEIKAQVNRFKNRETVPRIIL